MAYTAWSVVFGEQPSAAKWNQLGANDAGFKDGSNFDTGVLQKNPYCFSVYLNADQTGVVDGSITTIQFASEFFDPSTDFNTTTYTYTAPLAGIYHFSGFLHVSGSGLSDTYIQLLVNGTDSYKLGRDRASDTNLMSSGSMGIDLSASDTVLLQGFANISSGTATFEGTADGQGDAAKFSGFLVHPT